MTQSLRNHSLFSVSLLSFWGRDHAADEFDEKRGLLSSAYSVSPICFQATHKKQALQFLLCHTLRDWSWGRLTLVHPARDCVSIIWWRGCNKNLTVSTFAFQYLRNNNGDVCALKDFYVSLSMALEWRNKNNCYCPLKSQDACYYSKCMCVKWWIFVNTKLWMVWKNF